MSGMLLYGFAAALFGGIEQSLGRRVRRIHRRRARESRRRLCGRHRDQAHRGARHHRRRAAGASLGPLRPHPGDAGMSLRQQKILWLAAFGALLVILPFVLSSYHVFQLTMVVVYAIVLLGLNILTGFNGQVSLGHGAFFAIGAYTTAILLDKTAIPYWATVPMGGAVCLVADFLFGLPALRLEGLYLALATFALAVATPQILKYRDSSIGPAASRASPSPSPIRRPVCRSTATSGSISFVSSSPCRSFVIGWNLLRARTGRALVAIRDHPMAASADGHRHRLLQIRDLRHQRHVHRRRRRAGRGDATYVAPTVSRVPFNQFPGRHRRRRNRLDFGHVLRRHFHRVHSQFRGTDIEGGARRHIRHLPDRVDVSHANGSDWNLQLYRSPFRRRAVAKCRYYTEGLNNNYANKRKC